MDMLGSCCESCCECFNDCQGSDLAFSCAIFGGPNCICCPGDCCEKDCCQRCRYAKKKINGKYTEVFNAPSQIEMTRTDLVF